MTPLGMENTFYLIAGPSGVGKTTLVEWLLPRVRKLVSLQKAVTRGLRPGEQQGREVVSIDALSFQKKVDEGSIITPYQKYGEWYGLFASSGEYVNGSRLKIAGADALNTSDAITVGDSYEAPAAMRKVIPDIVVIMLYAPYEVIMERLSLKRMSLHQRQIRLATIRKEFEAGFPNNLEPCNYLLSMERPIDIVGSELLSIVEAHRSIERFSHV